MRQIITREELQSLADAAPRLAAFARSGLKAFTPPHMHRSAFVAVALAVAVSGAAPFPRPSAPLSPDRDGFSTHEIQPLVAPAAERTARMFEAVRSAFLQADLGTGPSTDIDLDDGDPFRAPVTVAFGSGRKTTSSVGAVVAPPVAVVARASGALEEVAAVPRKILNAVMHAAGRTGLDPAFLLSVAWTESRMDTTARNPESSAAGPFQFTRVGWFESVYRFGAEHGLDATARRISKNPDGAMVVERGARTRILAMRDDPVPSALMAAAVMKQDSLAVEAVTGRRAGLADMYLLHLMGTAGAVHFVSVATSGRHVRSDAVAPVAVANNPGLFVRDGRVMSASDAYAGIEHMMKARWRVYDAMLAGHRAQANPEIVEVASAPSPR